MNHLFALMLAYALVSVGSALLATRTNNSHLFGLMSLLYLFIAIGAIGLVLSLLNPMSEPLSQDFLVQAGEADVALREGGDSPDSSYHSFLEDGFRFGG